MDDLGKSKCKLMETRSMGVINGVERFMSAEDFPKYDVVLSCVDSSSFRRELYEFWASKKDKGDLKFWVDGRCQSRTISVLNSETDPETLKNYTTDKDIRASCLLANDKENNVSHLSPMIVAALEVQTLMNWLRGITTKERTTQV